MVSESGEKSLPSDHRSELRLGKEKENSTRSAKIISGDEQKMVEHTNQWTLL